MLFHEQTYESNLCVISVENWWHVTKLSEKNKLNNQAFAKLARKSVALKPYKFEHNNSTHRVCAVGTCVALCQLKVICVRPLIILIFAHFAENNNYIYSFIYCAFKLFVRCIRRAVFTVVTETNATMQTTTQFFLTLSLANEIKLN